MATTSPPLHDWTVADLYDLLGPIPVSRIRRDPPPGQGTEEDVVEIHDRENRLYELVDGVLVEKTVATYESYLAMLIGHLLLDFARPRNLGVVLGADGMMRLFPGRVRIPDVSFISRRRPSPGKISRSEPIADLAPDLAVEVISLSNTKKEMAQKLLDYFASGTRLVWYFDPGPRIVTVFRSPEQSTTLHEDQTLDGGDVLPGFALPLRGFFDEPDLEGGEPRGGANGAGPGG